MMVRWNDTLSGMFCASNGVKQGGVLSPILFSIYLADLIAELRSLNVGHINGLVGEMYARNHDILFNPSKTTCTYFSLKPKRLPSLYE